MPPADPVAALTRRVTRFFKAHAAEYDLDPSLLKVGYILNPGGYVNASFTIQDAQHALHLKLSDDLDSLDCMARWQSQHAWLSNYYHAPRVLGWVELPEGDFAGLLFAHVAGRPADFAHEPALHKALLDLLAQLHADRTLADGLAAELETRTCADCFIETYIDRFDEDLLIVVGDLPPFVSLPTLDWMQGETRHLEALARETACFEALAGSPIHGDLWQQNVLVAEDGRWHVLDWDDLTLGDPALDYSILLGPSLAALPPEARVFPAHIPPNSALRQRMQLYLRAYLLDGVIDSLADYVEAGFAPEYQAQVQAEKQAHHQQALQLYQRLYGEM